MFCVKCGAELPDDSMFCVTCGENLARSNQKTSYQIPDAGSDNKVPAIPNNKVKILRYIYFGLAAIILIMFFIASLNINAGGTGISYIQSVGGKTLEEAYYKELGSIYKGYAAICRGMGIFFSSVLVWLGLKSK